MTKHVSLLTIDPMALIQLRTTGRCTVRLPEALFDMDCSGHYFRRIKSVAVSIPCVTGPYSGVNCTLTLLKSSTRINPSLRGGGYARLEDDDRFSDYFGSLQSIVTSSAQNDIGLFEANTRDERYLPFENSGVISEWQLQLPANPSQNDPAQFDYETISDVILHLRYTAREGGGLLRSGALANLKAAIKDANVSGCVRLFSIRQEFPSEWARFVTQMPAADQRYELALALGPEHYPFWAKNLLNGVSRVDILARSAKVQTPASLDIYDQVNDLPQAAKKDTLVKAADLSGLLVGRLTGGAAGIALPANPVGSMKLYLDGNALSDFWLAITWSGK